MILQRDTSVCVWGSADAEVTLSLDGSCVSTSPTDGSFELMLPPHKAGGPYTMTLTSKDECMIFEDVYFGDVFIAGGQSNMGLTLAEAPQELVKSRHSVRMFTPDREWEYDRRPRTDMRWVEVCDENADGISAVASHFATELSAELDIPVGIVSCNQGATCVRTWISPETCASDAFLSSDPTFHSDAYEFPFNTYSHQYNERLLALAPYTAKGVIWYQGESDCSREIAPHYAHMFDLMVRDWRRLWRNEELPFITVQLTNYIKYRPDDAWEIVREQQLSAAQVGHNIGMITTGDVGDLEDIHPKNKKTVGQRLALYARGMIYGEDILYRPPVCIRAERDGESVRLCFSDVGEGLYESEELEFIVLDANGVERAAKYKLCGDSVLLCDVADADEVRFCYTTESRVALYSSVGLPAAPFRIKIK